MDGTISQSRVAITGYDSDGNYVYSSNKETNTYESKIGFSNTDRNAIYKYSTQVYEGESQTIEDYTYFEDEEGYAYAESLSINNEVTRDYSINLTTSSFEYNGFYNPFSILDEADFSVNSSNENRYDLDINKAGIIANNLLYSLNSGFATAVKSAYFIFNGTTFSSFRINMNDYIYEGDDAYYKVSNNVYFILSEVGSYHIDGATPFADKGYVALETGLKAIKDNFTMHVKKKINEQVSATKSEEYVDFYFADGEIYVHSYSDSNKSAVDKTADFYLAPSEDNTLYSYVYDSASSNWNQKSVSTAFPSLYQGKYTFEDYCPKISSVSSNFFKYNDESGYYEAEESMAEILPSYFYLGAQPFKKGASNSFIDVEITCNDSMIDKVILPFSYFDISEGSILTGSYELTFSEINSTVLPK